MDGGKLKATIAELSEAASAPDLWNDQEQAQTVTSKLSHTQAELKRIQDLRQRLDDLSVLFELGEDDPDTLVEAQQELVALQSEIDAQEVRTLLSGEYDEREALVTIRSEAGGVDAAGLRPDGDQRLPLVVLAGEQSADFLGVDLGLQGHEFLLRLDQGVRVVLAQFEQHRQVVQPLPEILDPLQLGLGVRELAGDPLRLLLVVPQVGRAGRLGEFGDGGLELSDVHHGFDAREGGVECFHCCRVVEIHELSAYAVCRSGLIRPIPAYRHWVSASGTGFGYRLWVSAWRGCRHQGPLPSDGMQVGLNLCWEGTFGPDQRRRCPLTVEYSGGPGRACLLRGDTR